MIFNHDDTDPGATMEHICGNCGCDLAGRKHLVECANGEMNVCEKCKCKYEAFHMERMDKAKADVEGVL